MFSLTPSTIPSSKASLLRTRRSSICYCAALALAGLSLVAACPARAVNSDQDTAANHDSSALTLAFSDDFSTNPNTNGQWTIHRYVGDPNTEAVWDSSRQAFDLILPATYRSVAAFANYELTATTWKAEFRYRAGKLGGVQNGGDGFIFMFYKNKAAYGTPAFGADKGFSLSNGITVKGYGLQFDNYIEGCDPPPTDYYSLIQDDVCSFLDGHEFDWIGTNNWHLVQVAFSEGTLRISIDGETTLTTHLTDPDYSFSGVGFSSGSGSAVGDYEIDSFRLWVLE
jgi:hypothetical protein